MANLGAAKAVALHTIIGADVPLKKAGRVYLGLCPFHQEKTPSFYVYSTHYHCFGCSAHGDAIDYVTRVRNLPFREAVHELSRPLQHAVAAQRQAEGQTLRRDTSDLARRIWCESVDGRGTPAQTYFGARLRRGDFEMPGPGCVRYHPACPRGTDRFPAAVALMTDPISGQPTGIHRTYIRPDGSGKADGLNPSKMMLGNAGVVRLVPDEGVGEGLGVAEGIETALAITHLLRWGPCWATCGREGMRTFPVLPEKTLTIFADSGKPGVDAAVECGSRWVKAGAEAWVHVPPPRDADWLDSLLREACP